MAWTVIERSGAKIYRPYYRTIKRIIDLTACLILAPFAAVVAVFAAIAVRRDTPGPIFFVQDRIGKGGRPFKIIKFRTMHHSIDKNAHREFMKNFVKGEVNQGGPDKKTYKPFADQQVTRVGRILRKTSLDELPQLINVFRGEMSFIGPRPNVLWEVEAYRGWHKERLEILPGITGLAQVRGRSGIVFDKIVEFDIEYIEKQSLLLDIKIIWWTIASVLFGNGAE